MYSFLIVEINEENNRKRTTRWNSKQQKSSLEKAKTKTLLHSISYQTRTN
jgi:hypothetical protein